MKKLIDNYDVIIFDCDGVLIDSNEAKVSAFGHAVKKYPKEVIDAFVSHCRNTFGISRYVKFKEFFSKFADEDFSKEKYDLFLNRYAEETYKSYLKASLTISCERFLNNVHNNSALYVASGSKETELQQVFKERSINRYFKGIYGSPKTKKECIEKILESEDPMNCLFIGDSLSDLEAAQAFEFDFMYMKQYTVQSDEKDKICKENAKIIIDNFNDLLI